MSSAHPVIIGADVGAKLIVLAWAASSLSIANTREAILAWLKSLPAGCVIGMEATGRYHQALADLALACGHIVYVLNPKHIAHYAQGLGQRGKTDQLDAAVICRYLERERDRLHPYTTPSPLQRELRDRISQRAALVRHCSALKQSLKATSGQANAALRAAQRGALKALDKLLTEIEKELKAAIAAHPPLEAKRKQLQTITGIGSINSIALTHRFDRTPFANSDAVVAAYGMDLKPNDSGNRIGKRHLTKQGNAEDRRLIYLAAQSAAKTQWFAPLYRALREKGFASTQAIIIIARKLLRIAFAVWTTGQDFDPKKIGKNACTKP